MRVAGLWEIVDNSWLVQQSTLRSKSVAIRSSSELMSRKAGRAFHADERPRR
jgi:hypothetical protein